MLVMFDRKFRFITTIVALLCILALTLPATLIGQQADDKNDDKSSQEQKPEEKKEYPKKLEAKLLKQHKRWLRRNQIERGYLEKLKNLFTAP